MCCVPADGIEPLVVMLKNEDPAVREAASMALANLTTSNMTNCQWVSDSQSWTPCRQVSLLRAISLFLSLFQQVVKGERGGIFDRHAG